MMNSPNNQQTLLEELIQGRDLANQLEEMLHENLPGEMNMSLKLVDNVEGRRTIQSTTRRRSQPHSSNKANTLDDGYSWRKYGQKAIYNSKFPRCYYRCTNKFSHRCYATRQVQQCEEDPSLFLITYFGKHTCNTTSCLDQAQFLKVLRSKAIDDRYSWRKYGQKEIYNSKFPRCYYRCTHKVSRSCNATKQVQQCEEDPPLFLIWYFGKHTCNTTSCLYQDNGSNILDFTSSSINASQFFKIESFKIESDIEEGFSANMISGVSSMDVLELGTMEMQPEQSDVTSGFMQSLMGNSAQSSNVLTLNGWKKIKCCKLFPLLLSLSGALIGLCYLLIKKFNEF